MSLTKVRNWLVIGISRNWETALSHPVPLWGLKQRYKVEFQAMMSGDVLWLYATKPVGGIIGVGMVKDKYVDPVNLVWEEELVEKKVIWPLRFRIQVLKVLPLDRWRSDCLKINDFNLFWQQGFQLLKSKQVIELVKRAERAFGVLEIKDIFAGATIAQTSYRFSEQTGVYSASEGSLAFSHRDIQNFLAEIGKLQFYYSEIEYSLDLSGERKNLDVVWKREIDGAPTFAFEVELSGMLEKAVERLRFAFKKWNSQPRLVVSNESLSRANNILSLSEREFSTQLKIYEPKQIWDLLSRKRELKAVEETLKLY